MLILSTTTGRFGTNVHVIAEGPGQPCLIIDPGHGAAPVVRDLVRTHRLLPEGVLITHGHMDHTWDAVPLARHYGIPSWIHPADRYQFGAPAMGLPDDFPAELLVGHPNEEPEQVADLPRPGGVLSFATTSVTVLHTPGHTIGSVMFRIAADPPLLATGDTLLASGPGHSQAPTGDAASLADSVRSVLGQDGDDTLVLAGHGPRTTLGAIVT